MGKYDVAAYVWPSYTGDDIRARIFWDEGFGEWQSVKSAGAKFEGHNWPRKPLWGYQNEADAKVMEMQIDEAVKHDVNVFIYDWYWYDRHPFLENCLNDGFLKASNNDKMKFYIMWANHDASYLWDKRNSHLDTLIWDGSLDRDEFEIIANRLIDKYFTHQSYYLIEGKPVFSIFDPENLIKGLGGIKNTKEAFDWFRELAVEKGLEGLHFQLILRNDANFAMFGKEDQAEYNLSDVVSDVGFDSITHYQFAMITDIDREYDEVASDVVAQWPGLEKEYGVPYYPSVSLGWDNNPRFIDFKPGITKNCTPENIEKALIKAKDYIDNHSEQPPLMIINSWNEWTETSYLQPDDLYGYGYLEAVRKTFG